MFFKKNGRATDDSSSDCLQQGVNFVFVTNSTTRRPYLEFGNINISQLR